MNQDIAKVLRDWPYEDSSNVRRLTGDDGREKIQIRVCLETFHGILQFECDGRPDGKRPRGFDFYLDYLEQKRRRQEHQEPPGPPFSLTHAQCLRLFEESSLVYHRYVVLLQLGDHTRVLRDTSRNMRLFRFVNRYAALAADRAHLESWWPYLLRIHCMAQVMEQIEQTRVAEALDAVLHCRHQIEALAPLENETFQGEKKRSLEALAEMEKELRERLPLSAIEKLEREKQQAIAQQRFEDAARLRDQIRALGQAAAPPTAPPCA